jgi:hypothetical protein
LSLGVVPLYISFSKFLNPCGVAFGAVCFIAMQSLDRLGFGLCCPILSGILAT